MAVLGDPVAAGLVASLARPDENLTGLTFFCAKRVELIREVIPMLTRVAVLVNPANPSHAIALEAMQKTAGVLRLEVVPLEVNERQEIGTAIAGVARGRAQALVAIEGSLV